MDYRILGRSGLRVSELCLGTMTFGSDWGWGADRDESRRIFDAFVAAGGNFIDTANNYTDGSSEEFVGEFVAEARDQFVVATKYTLSIDADDPNAGGNHRKSLVRSLEQSLRRLRTDYVDLLWLHMYDATTPIEEAVRALDDQVRLGKVLAVGISDSPAWVVAQANTVATLRGWSPFTALQIPYNVASREPERELLPMAQALGLALTPWGVLEAGILTGKPASERRWPEETVSDTAGRVLTVLQELGEERDATTAQVAIAWLLRRPAGLTIVPIIAARRREQIVDNLGALGVDLDADDIARLDAAGRPQLGFPRGFLESSNVRGLIYGNTFEKLRA
jgi:aryl-alcohol dehydrogenase-like predicted oxidoreductase